jgi:alpha-beta hydrolase superfamily lysophospholipase
MTVLDVKLQYMRLADGTPIYYQRWMPDSPKAHLIFVHDIADHVGRYAAFTGFFSGRGYGVHLFDMRGHGKSGGRRFYINSIHDFLSDLYEFIDFIKKTSATAPLILVGYGFGGQIVLNFTVKYDKGLRAVIAISPNIRDRVGVPGWKLKLLRLVNRVNPYCMVGGNWLDPVLFTHSLNVIRDCENDPSFEKKTSIKCAFEIIANSDLMMGIAGRIHLPVFMACGGDDIICDPEKVRKFFIRIPVYNKMLKTYPTILPDIFTGVENSQLFWDIDRWLEEQLGVESKIASSQRR